MASSGIIGVKTFGFSALMLIIVGFRETRSLVASEYLEYLVNI
jgi:hypothetical protein